MRCMTKIVPLFYPGTLWCFRILSSSPASHGQGSEASHSFAARNPEISSTSWQSSEWNIKGLFKTTTFPQPEIENNCVNLNFQNDILRVKSTGHRPSLLLLASRGIDCIFGQSLVSRKPSIHGRDLWESFGVQHRSFIRLVRMVWTIAM